jgi:16S rRNA (guanine966-N2)-methyltransferase
MTRVIAGTAGGRRLHTPPGRDTRPTADRVREALFSSLGDISGAHVLDLFAGSGALGLEALSRGAATATFVEHAAPALTALRRNIADLALGSAVVVPADVTVFLTKTVVPQHLYDLVLVDPPYASEVDTVLALLPDQMAPGATLVVERGSRGPVPSWPAAFAQPRSRRYGETTLWYLRHP